jgi:hypothetical protein
LAHDAPVAAWLAMEPDDWTAARMGEPVALVGTWLESVFDRSDLASAWPLTEMPLRLALAQSWIYLEQDREDVQRYDRDELANLLATEAPTLSLWTEFAGWRLVRWREVLPSWVIDLSRRGFVDTTQLVSGDLEAVLVADVQTGTLTAGEPVEVQRFLVRHVHGRCLLAGIGGVLPVPGWPPTETDRLPT